MRAIPAAELLQLWEQGVSDPPFLRALRLLAASLPEQSPGLLAAWSLGRRDDALLTLRERLFGEQCTAIASCLACGARVELEFRTADIRAPYALDEHAHVRHVLDSRDTYTVELRPLASHDLIVAVHDPGRSALIYPCIVEARRNGGPVPVQELPPQVMQACAQALSQCDPQADVQLALTCPDCGHAWDAPFDITTYLWREIETWAERTLREVHLLASVYGWSEADILSQSATRRQHYLAMVTE